MRPLVKTLLLFLGIAALLVLLKGFPMAAKFLKVLFLHPIGWVVLGVLAFWIYRLRTRAARRDHHSIIDDPPKRLPQPR